MFGSLEEAIKLGDAAKNRKNDGGVPVFELRAVPKAGVNQTEVEYEDVVWVKIFNKGDSKNIQERPVREEDKQRWPDHWKAFQENSEAPLNGIPLEDFPQITPAERMKLKAMHVRTIEELIELPDQQLERLGGRGRAIHKAAREFKAYMDGEQVSDLQDEVKELKDQLKALQKELSSGNSTGSNTKRSTGNKSSKTKRSNSGGSRPRRKSVSDSEDSGESS